MHRRYILGRVGQHDVEYYIGHGDDGGGMNNIHAVLSCEENVLYCRIVSINYRAHTVSRCTSLHATLALRREIREDIEGDYKNCESLVSDEGHNAFLVTRGPFLQWVGLQFPP
jgi:hypothetical protein